MGKGGMGGVTEEGNRWQESVMSVEEEDLW